MIPPMSIEPRKFFEFYKDLWEEQPPEIIRRNLISRGYYFAYHYVRANWENNSDYPRIRKRSKHIAAQKFLEKKSENELAELLDTMHKQRKKADYKLQADVGISDLSKFDIRVKEFTDGVRNLTF